MVLSSWIGNPSHWNQRSTSRARDTYVCKLKATISHHMQVGKSEVHGAGIVRREAAERFPSSEQNWRWVVFRSSCLQLLALLHDVRKRHFSIADHTARSLGARINTTTIRLEACCFQEVGREKDWMILILILNKDFGYDIKVVCDDGYLSLCL